jgi:hypothetical protein
MAFGWVGPLGPLAASLAAQATMYGGFALRWNDNDKQKKWGGKVHKGAAAGEFVRELQDDLTKVGCYDAKLDGDYGGSTRDAVKRFQWCVSKGTHKSSSRQSLLKEIVNDGMIFVTGNCDHATARHLKAWVKDGFVVTGTLRVVALGKFSEFRKGTLKKIDHPSVAADDMVVHKDYVAGLESINTAADDAGVTFQVNQAFREAGKPVSGAVVKPASKSQHLIGNAIDFNINDSGDVILSSEMVWSKLSQPAKDFITAVKTAGLRWGGDFTDRDPIHFDAYLDPSSDEFAILYFLNQRTIQKKQPILRVT